MERLAAKMITTLNLQPTEEYREILLKTISYNETATRLTSDYCLRLNKEIYNNYLMYEN